MLKKLQRHGLYAIGLCLILITTSGCFGAAAQLFYVLYGHKTKAAYAGLEGKKVAVICVSDEVTYGPDTLTQVVNKLVSRQLATNVKRISIIPPSTIDSWVDMNGWNEVDYVEIGRGVKADMVVAIEVGGFTIHDGKTLFKGQSNVTVTVYNAKAGGEVEYVYGPTDYVFPKVGRPIMQSSEQQFETIYLAKLSDQISRLFYDSDSLDEVADDATFMR